MNQPVSQAIGELVPHAGRMSLLDRALGADETGMVTEVQIRPDCLFHDGEGVGGWVGIEYMAQSIAAWSGWHARQRGERPHVGFLLGTRRYECTRARFRTGETLRIEVRQTFWSEDRLGQFECSIHVGEERVARAALTVYEPPARDERT